VIYFSGNVSSAIDRYDAAKMLNTNSSTPELYTVVAGEKLVINGLSLQDKLSTVALGVNKAKATSLSIKASELKNLDADTRVMLVNNNTQTQTDITDGVAVSIDLEASYSIAFRAGSITGLDASAVAAVNVFVNSANQLVISAPEKSIYNIYNAMGQLIEHAKTTAKLQTANCKLQTGIYVVRVNNVTTKVIIK